MHGLFILIGAGGWPDIRYSDGTDIAPQLDLRMALDLYARVRPIRWFPGLPGVQQPCLWVKITPKTGRKQP